MKGKLLVSSALLGALVSTSPAVWAQDDRDEELDVIMDVVGEDEEPDDVVRRIELPAPETSEQTQVGARGAIDPRELERVKNLVNELLQDTDSTLNNAINDAIAAGELDRLPDIIRDNLPEDLVEDLSSDVEELTDQVADDLPLETP